MISYEATKHVPQGMKSMNIRSVPNEESLSFIFQHATNCRSHHPDAGLLELSRASELVAI